MAQLVWDQAGDRTYETGVDKGVLYLPDSHGNYVTGVAWSGLTSVSEAPTGGDANAQYADNIKWLNLFSVEQFAATLMAFTYPDEFAPMDGLYVPEAGVMVGQQTRKGFGLCYRSLIGNDVDGTDHGYKLHLVYGLHASPSQKDYATVNDQPAPIDFSWALTSTPVPVPGKKPTSLIIIDSTKVNPEDLAALEQTLYGAEGVDPALPLPAAVLAMFAGSVSTVTPTVPSFDSETNTITIPTQTGVTYFVDGAPVPSGALVIAADTIVVARPNDGYVFTADADNDWSFTYTP